MRILILVITGMIMGFTACEKDRIIGGPICKPENRPEITDTGKVNNQRLIGKWKLVNTRNFAEKGYLIYDSLTGRQPLLNFKQTKLNAKLNINKCYNAEYHVFKREKNWLIINQQLSCTQIASGKWESHYKTALTNPTCYKIAENKLTLQYYINKNKYGKLIYEKVN